MNKQSILDEFVVLKELGRGIQGKVKLIRSLEQKQDVYAAKVLVNPNFSLVQTFLKEAAILQKVDHTNVCKPKGIREAGQYFSRKHNRVFELPYILLEYCTNGSLFEYLDPSVGGGKFEEPMAKFLYK